MKTYFLSLSLFLSATFFALAQDADVEYRVTKEYNEMGISSAMIPLEHKKTNGSALTTVLISMRKT